MKVLLITLLLASAYGGVWVNEKAMEAIEERGRVLS